LVASLWLALVVAIAEPWAWGISGVALLVMAGSFVSYGSAQVRLTDGVLHVGRAHIGVEHLGRVEVLGKDEMRLAAGRDADPRAFMVLRPYLKRGVRIEVVDPSDPAPYWLFHTRRGQDLANALAGALDR
ncbi:MAG: DUF3093 domain-containing protein, partial [Nocardioides sp.]|uniref:DUF3093 domain-containing protein n=1 Tax=Nocardioides sp. TaxID=35761 RepID=UPI003F0A0C79